MHENFKWAGAGWYASRQEEFDHVQYINTYWVAGFEAERDEADSAARHAGLGTPHRYAGPPASTEDLVVWNASDEQVTPLFRADPTYEAAPGLTVEFAVAELNGDEQSVMQALAASQGVPALDVKTSEPVIPDGLAALMVKHEGELNARGQADLAAWRAKKNVPTYAELVSYLSTACDTLAVVNRTHPEFVYPPFLQEIRDLLDRIPEAQ